MHFVFDVWVCVSCQQELRRMESFQHKPSLTERRNSVLALDVGADPSQLKSELMIQQRKFDRLEYKEKRFQVRYWTQWRNQRSAARRGSLPQGWPSLATYEEAKIIYRTYIGDANLPKLRIAERKINRATVYRIRRNSTCTVLEVVLLISSFQNIMF